MDFISIKLADDAATLPISVGVAITEIDGARVEVIDAFYVRPDPAGGWTRESKQTRLYWRVAKAA